MERTGQSHGDMLWSLAQIVRLTPPHRLVALQIVRERLSLVLQSMFRKHLLLSALAAPTLSQDHVAPYLRLPDTDEGVWSRRPPNFLLCCQNSNPIPTLSKLLTLIT